MEVESPLSVDVAIIGSGPAGSTLAALLASRGVSVALIDRDTFPRDKVCGEFLSYDALPILALTGGDLAIDSSGATSIDHCRIVTDRGTYEFPLPRAARGVSRHKLDHLLLRRATAAGAEAVEGWAADQIEPDAEGTRITLTRKDAERRIVNAKLVAGAWGRWGRLDLKLQRSFVRDHAHRHFGFKRHYVRSDSTTSSAIELYSFRRGYLGVSAVEGGRTNICGLVHASRIEKMRGGWEAFTTSLTDESESLRTLFASHDPVQPDFLSSDPVIFRPKSSVEDGVMLVGDSAGLVDPLAGNGMAMAIQSALLAATLIVPYLRGSSSRQQLEREYGTRFASLFHRRIWWSRRVASLLSRPSLLETAVRAVKTESFGRLLLARTRATDPEIGRLLHEWNVV